MEAKEITQAAEMYNDDLLWVMCVRGTHYTNEMCDIMPGAFADEEKFYRCKSLKETAAKFAELCLKAGCSPGDIFTGY